MSTTPDIPRSFAYQAQGDDGRRVTGTIDALDAGTAMLRLQALRLRVVQIDPLDTTPGAPAPGAADGTGAPARSRARALHGDDFAAFNQQLAHLTAAGLPVEAGLRLIAQDMRSGRLAATVRLVADELERGTPLGEAFEKHRARFPALYGRLLEAGVKGGDLSGVLLNLGRHMEMVQRLRSLLWRTVSYPLTVLVALAVVMTFLGLYVIPQFELLFDEFGLKLPAVTQLVFSVATFMPYLGAAVLVLLLVGPFVWAALRLRGQDVTLVDTVGLRVPLVGRALRLNLIARWCDSLRIGVAAGLDLPAAIALAGDAVRSPRLRGDGRVLTALVEAGRPLTGAADEMELLPATVPATIELAAGHHDLAETLRTLAEMYERQAELRTSAIPAVLTPILIVAVAVSVGMVIAALLLPMLSLIEGISGP